MTGLESLEHAARAFVAEVESPSERDRATSMLGVVSMLLACAARAQESGARVASVPPVAPRAWSVSETDELRTRTALVFEDDDDETRKARVNTKVAELYASVAPFVRALDAGNDRDAVLRTLAWDVRNAWGHTAADLVRPLWELATW